MVCAYEGSWGSKKVTKITAWVIRKSKTVKKINIDEGKRFFKFNHGLYSVTPDVTLTTKKNEQDYNKHEPVEIFYWEGDPAPIKSSESGATFLNELVLENALRDVGQPKSQVFSFLSEALHKPMNLLFMGIAIFIPTLLVYWLLTGSFHT
jgi:hypothetical protein